VSPLAGHAAGRGKRGSRTRRIAFRTTAAELLAAAADAATASG
jgi:hypothetical protein